MDRFSPLLDNPHLMTIAAGLWPRRLDERRFPVEDRHYATEPGVRILVRSQRPDGRARGELVLVHGLEGSSEAGYLRGLAQAALEDGFAVHRVNTRGCGGTEPLCQTLYHAGLTADLRFLLEELRRLARAPVWLVGFSLGGNQVLKLAGELGGDAGPMLAGVCAVSAPIDLAACVRRLDAPDNRLYQWRFLRSMKSRMRRRHRLMPERFPLDGMAGVQSVYEFDDRITAPAFDFRGADHYYETQSAGRFLSHIRVPALLIQAKDDPLIPFSVFEPPYLPDNPALRLIAADHGGHVGFLAGGASRFWLDRAILAWIGEQRPDPVR